MSAQDNETMAMPDVPEMAASGLGAPFTAVDPVAQAINEGENRYRQTVLGQDPLPGMPVVTDDPFALPAWLIDADAEERRELEELGVTLAPKFDADAERDAILSRLMRAHHEHAADVERYDAAEVIEHQKITQRYDRLRAPAKRQMVRLASFIVHIVSSVTFPGKKKSRSVGWGSYGLRKDRDKVDVANMVTVVDALRKIEPQSVKVEVTTNAKVQQAVEVLLNTAIASGQLQLTGTDVSVLSELRAQLRGAVPSVSKTDVATLLKIHGADKIPGASVTIGADKPWFEVEPPTDGN